MKILSEFKPFRIVNCLLEIDNKQFIEFIKLMQSNYQLDEEDIKCELLNDCKSYLNTDKGLNFFDMAHNLNRGDGKFAMEIMDDLSREIDSIKTQFNNPIFLKGNWTKNYRLCIQFKWKNN